jgi:Concanavalin A-like lectin/glucanases superfamily
LYATPSNDLKFHGVSSNTTPNLITANKYVQVVLTRDASGVVTGYVDGAQQFQLGDSGKGVISSANLLRFFQDNLDGGSPGEASAGSVARIRVYNYALTFNEVQGLDRLPSASCAGAPTPTPTPGGSPTPTPTPTSCATVNPGPGNWYPAEGNANDVRGGQNATLQNGASFTAGKVGQAFDFNGNEPGGNQVLTPTLNLGNQFTVEFWARPTSSFYAFRDLIANDRNNPPTTARSIGTAAPLTTTRADNVEYLRKLVMGI